MYKSHRKITCFDGFIKKIDLFKNSDFFLEKKKNMC
jgi:hypothetical protein